MENIETNRAFFRKLIAIKKVTPSEVFSLFPKLSFSLQQYIVNYSKFYNRKKNKIIYFTKRKNRLKHYKALQEREKQGNLARTH